MSLPRLSCSLPAGRIGLLQAQMLCWWDPLVPKDGALAVWFCHLHHCHLTLLVPFPVLKNIPGFAHLTKTSAIFPFTSTFLSFHPTLPRSDTSQIGKLFHSMSAGVSHKSVLCFRNSVPSLSPGMGFFSRSVISAVFFNLLPWFWCPLRCPPSFLVSHLAFPVAY